jgi:geranylgeranyl diphosphate synthase type I
MFGNRNSSEQDIKKIYDMFNKFGSVEYAKNTAYKYSMKAKNSLKSLNDSDAKQVLIELAEYSIKREK